MTIPWGWLILVAAGSAAFAWPTVAFARRHPVAKVPLWRQSPFDRQRDAFLRGMGVFGVVWGAASSGSAIGPWWTGGAIAAVGFLPGLIAIFVVNSRAEASVVEDAESGRNDGTDGAHSER